MTMKTCFKCGLTLDISEFYKHPQMGDGHLGKCKQCTKNDTVTRYYQKHELVRAYDAMRQKTSARREKKKIYHKTYNEKSPEKRLAHAAVNNAIRCKKLIPQPCAICGTTMHIEAHHEDYSCPLSVIWLCRYHHKVHHGFIKENMHSETLTHDLPTLR